MAWSSALGWGAQLSQQWSAACLSYTLRVMSSTLRGLLVNVSAPLVPSGESPQEPVWGGPARRHGCSVTRADARVCLLARRVQCDWVVSFPLEPTCRGQLAAILAATLSLFSVLCATSSDQGPRTGPLRKHPGESPPPWGRPAAGGRNVSAHRPLLRHPRVRCTFRRSFGIAPSACERHRMQRHQCF